MTGEAPECETRAFSGLARTYRLNAEQCVGFLTFTGNSSHRRAPGFVCFIIALNNLQVIIAFRSLRMREGSPELRDAFSAVQAIALAQDLLSIGAQLSSVDFGEYLRSLCANIDPQRRDVTIEVEAEHALIPIDRAVPAGLVVNELVTNAIKYAFGNDGGKH